ncbi:hypothetical protein F5Y06DRAFT_301932 [Hypoxylon sp. FL0890]|nr:hypothetical protein F5Y06DRAFT_301932 [Hypoxylon sp. FL0890]
MGYLRTLFTTALHLPAVALVLSLLIFSLLFTRLQIYFLQIRVFYRSIQQSQNRPVISGLKLILVYCSAQPFVFESCGTVIWAFILFKAASRVTYVLSWLPLLIVIGHMGNRALRMLGGPIRALLNGHCARLARDYRWDRFLVDVLILQQRRNVFARIVLYLADTVHASSTASRWQDSMVQEFERRNIFGSGHYAYQALLRMYHDANCIGPDWRRPSWARED